MYLSITSTNFSSWPILSLLDPYLLSPCAQNNYEAVSQTSYHYMCKCSCILIFSLRKSWNPNKNCRGSKHAALQGLSSHCGSDQAALGLAFWRVCIGLLLLRDFGLAEAEGAVSPRESHSPVSGRRLRSDGTQCFPVQCFGTSVSRGEQPLRWKPQISLTWAKGS